MHVATVPTTGKIRELCLEYGLLVAVGSYWLGDEFTTAVTLSSSFKGVGLWMSFWGVEHQEINDS